MASSGSTEQQKRFPIRLSGQALIGGIIVLIGALLLVHTTGVYDTTQMLRFVPSLFVLVGLYVIVASRLQNLSGPLVLVLVAGAIQLVTLDLISGSDVLSLWPVLLIVAGLSILLGQFRSSTRPVSASQVDVFALLGGNAQRATSDTFAGGTLTAILGGVELDLRETRVEDRPARINSTTLFGGTEITVPEDWIVQVDILPILGGIEDTRLRREREEDKQEVDLVITGFVAFGGLTVKD